MSRLAEFRKLEEQLAIHLQELENLKNDQGLKKEIEFEEKLRDLMAEYDQDLSGIIAILDPQASPARAKPVKSEQQPKRRERKVKVYKNPETGEVVETKGGNHKVLKAWKERYGAEAVESWVQ